MNIIWPFFIIVSIVYGIITGNSESLNNEIFNSLKQATELTITFFGTICLWNGIMKIAIDTTFVKRLTNVLRPILKFLFPDIDKNSVVYDEISTNIAANVLGLGNAATPMGLKAMKSMQKDNKNKDTISNSMAMLILLNTASIQIIPTTVIAIRTSLGSNQPTKIIFAVWISSLLAAIAGIISTKLLMKRY